MKKKDNTSNSELKYNILRYYILRWNKVFGDSFEKVSGAVEGVLSDEKVLSSISESE